MTSSSMSKNEETKPNSENEEESEEKLKNILNNLVENNTNNLSHDIYDGIEDILMYIDKHLINPKTCKLSFLMKEWNNLSELEFC